MSQNENLFENPTRFEDAISAFEAQEAQNPPPKNAVVFVGSSSFTLWEEIAEDFAPLPVIKRGFGGSFLSESVFYVDRLVTLHQPRAVVVYAGENDIGQGASGAEVCRQFQLLVEKIHAKCPPAEIFWVSIKPSPGRGAGIHQIRIANELIGKWIETTPRVTYIDISTPMLGEDAVGRAEWFLDDGVHMKRNGYELWRDTIKPFLMPLFLSM